MIRQTGVFGGSIEDDGERYIVGHEIVEEIDELTGRVVETTRDISKPSQRQRHVITNRRYQQIRAYLIGKRIEQQRIDEARAKLRPNWKPKATRRPKRVATAMTCPDCEGAGWFDGAECRACQGEGWRVT